MNIYPFISEWGMYVCVHTHLFGIWECIWPHLDFVTFLLPSTFIDLPCSTLFVWFLHNRLCICPNLSLMILLTALSHSIGIDINIRHDLTIVSHRAFAGNFLWSPSSLLSSGSRKQKRKKNRHCFYSSCLECAFFVLGTICFVVLCGVHSWVTLSIFGFNMYLCMSEEGVGENWVVHA